MKQYLFCVFMGATLFSINTIASDYTGWAVPSQIEIVQSGILIKGDFGNVNECKNSDEIFYGNTDTDYQLAASMVMTAIVAKKEMQFYADRCFDITFHGKNVNRVRNGSGIFFK
jgi:hypothetical protein